MYADTIKFRRSCREETVGCSSKTVFPKYGGKYFGATPNSEPKSSISHPFNRSIAIRHGWSLHLHPFRQPDRTSAYASPLVCLKQTEAVPTMNLDELVLSQEWVPMCLCFRNNILHC